MKEWYQQLCAGENVRASLIAIKKELKKDSAKKEFCALCANSFDVIMKCLVHEDPKVRKNAAAILGALKVSEAEDVLMDAYLEEGTLFVRPEYVYALAQLPGKGYVKEMQERLRLLQTTVVAEEEKKHVQEEMAALQEFLLKKDVQRKHTFCGNRVANQVILTTLPVFRDALAKEIPFQKTLLKSGVRASVGDLDTVMQCRLWQEMLFVISGKGSFPAEPKTLAQALAASDFLDILQRNHKEINVPFAFRIEVGGALAKEDKAGYAKEVALAVEEAFAGALINSVSHYEVELRLVVKKDADEAATVLPMLKLYTIPDPRFRYRRYHVAASMKPYVAAGIMALAAPYLKEYAQVLDPFCGVGTLLIERRKAGAVRSAYGLDTFGEAIEKARANTRLTGMPVNYVHRDFFDFTHGYLFDEIFADMPTNLGERREVDGFYRRFLEKSADLLEMGGFVFCYCAEEGILKKHVRITPGLRLVQSFCVSPKNGAHLFVIQKTS